jgi:hypothetical protein
MIIWLNDFKKKRRKENKTEELSTALTTLDVSIEALLPYWHFSHIRENIQNMRRTYKILSTKLQLLETELHGPKELSQTENGS